MALLVTGGTGYIGSKLVVQLAQTGQDIRVLCRSTPTLPEFQKSNIKIFKGDITDPGSLKTALNGVSRVYHLAAYARTWAKDPTVYHRLNVKGTENVLTAASAAGVQKVVYTSTAGVIGPSGDRPMTETDPRVTGFFNLYESTKSEAEAVALDFAKQGMEVCILNPSRIYGPGFDTGSNPITKIVELYIKRKWKLIPGSGGDIGSYPFIDDVVNAHISAMEKGRSGERYILGGVNASFNDLISVIKKVSGVDMKLRHVPFFALNALSYLMLWNAKLTGKFPMITPDWVAKYKYHWALDSSKAEKELDYKIRPLEEGIRETVEWLRQNRK
ncbi:MAG: SDR family oxidoreductase [Chitinophagaceae bacterium]|nr:SDR family oxidoreductase [Chitinophagaceae bacterium]